MSSFPHMALVMTSEPDVVPNTLPPSDPRGLYLSDSNHASSRQRSKWISEHVHVLSKSRTGVSLLSSPVLHWYLFSCLLHPPTQIDRIVDHIETIFTF
ncbi:hypothetical protein RRG08_050954 [Elysia crispata]|uniref:Uncharacterized protein n=1 Tax=Elysia crispata TaxID=231223 RepID=A0AAE0YQL6_9GAST|nr:hypothetical protein RRG08_050954 [Elysia crispata]